MGKNDDKSKFVDDRRIQYFIILYNRGYGIYKTVGTILY